jgi:hypothetical protein
MHGADASQQEIPEVRILPEQQSFDPPGFEPQPVPPHVPQDKEQQTVV